MYQQITYSGFGGGLNIRDKADAVDPTEAVDLMNVLFSERGAIRQRPGYAKLNSSALTNPVETLHPFYTTTGTKQLVAGAGTRLDALNTSGTVVASATGLTTGTWGFTRFGRPGTEYLYCGQGIDTLRRWDGSSWAAPTATVDGVAALAMPKAGLLAVQPKDNRLVATGYTTTTGGPAGGTTSPSHVYFSAEGDPETWTSTYFEQLTPGDGEKITALVTWRDFVFVFKETRFFVFYGNSVDRTGNPEFNYKVVDAGVGCIGPKAVVAARDGVYFLNRKGVYKTTGGDPTRVSEKISPIFTGDADPLYSGGKINQSEIANSALGIYEEHILVAFTSSNSTVNDRLLVYDTTYGWWSLFNIAAACLSTFRVDDDDQVVFGYSSTNYVGVISGDYTNDDGSAISSFWQSGWVDFGAQNVKRVREVKLWGRGVVSASLTRDYYPEITSTSINFDSALQTWGDGTGTDTWGDGTGTDLWGPVSGGITPRLYRHGVKGTVFSFKFKNQLLDQTWEVHKAVPHVAGSRQPTITQIGEG